MNSDTVPVDMDNPTVPHINGTSSDKVLKTQTTRFADAVPGPSLEYKPTDDDTFNDGQDYDVSLQEFFSRPIVVHSGVWPLGAVPDVDEPVWFNYFNNAQIKDKINHFNLLQCQLHLKVVVTGSSYNYGIMRLNYHPLPNLGGGKIITGGTKLVHLSQRPGIWIDASENKGGEMILPYINYKNWINIHEASDFTNMGTLNFNTPTPLANCNNGTEGTTVVVYAWAENVKLALPTSELALQSGKKVINNTTKRAPKNVKTIATASKSEWKGGFVEKTASAVAAAAGALTKMPIVGPCSCNIYWC